MSIGISQEQGVSTCQSPSLPLVTASPHVTASGTRLAPTHPATVKTNNSSHRDMPDNLQHYILPTSSPLYHILSCLSAQLMWEMPPVWLRCQHKQAFIQVPRPPSLHPNYWLNDEHCNINNTEQIPRPWRIQTRCIPGPTITSLEAKDSDMMHIESHEGPLPTAWCLSLLHEKCM